MSLVVPRGAFRWIRGEPRTYRTRSDSGADKDCVFCGDCGIRIYNELSSMPKTRNVKPGTLDDTRGLEPIVHTWLASKQAWAPIPEGVKTFERNPG